MQLTLNQNSGSQCYGNLIGKQSQLLVIDSNKDIF